MDNKYKHVGKDKKKFVENMFDNISFKYDFFNRLTTFFIDQYWRNKFIKNLHLKNNLKVLDIATGTGDVIIQICKKDKSISGTGFDCSQNMLKIARNKSKIKNLSDIEYIHGYAENLPFKDDSFDIITISFGIRNFNNYEKALNEINRILKPGGKLAILEFCRPKNSIFQTLFSFYFNKIIPLIGKVLTGEKIFDYLPESVNNFFSLSELESTVNKHSFKTLHSKNLTFGICSILISNKVNLKD